MTIKTVLTSKDFSLILSQYDLGIYSHSEPIEQGTVQSNYIIQTNLNKIVFRYYENRSIEAVSFESELIDYLIKHQYPCPAQIKNNHGSYIGTYHDKPFIIFEFIEGQSIEFPNEAHWIQLIKMAAELQNLTLDFQSEFTKYRWNYDPALCRDLANKQAREIKNKDAYDKLKWLENELLTLNLPTSIPKGICHCDFHYSNMLFRDDELVAVLDFDDANYTFLQFDLVGLVEYQAWPNDQDNLNYLKAHGVLQEYMKHRPLLLIEQIHLYDVYKLSILLDCVWYFNRGNYSDFREKRKIEALNCLGRNKFHSKLFKD